MRGCDSRPYLYNTNISTNRRGVLFLPLFLRENCDRVSGVSTVEVSVLQVIASMVWFVALLVWYGLMWLPDRHEEHRRYVCLAAIAFVSAFVNCLFLFEFSGVSYVMTFSVSGLFFLLSVRSLVIGSESRDLPIPPFFGTWRRPKHVTGNRPETVPSAVSSLPPRQFAGEGVRNEMAVRGFEMPERDEGCVRGAGFRSEKRRRRRKKFQGRR